jgi:hypothetical protein
VRMVMQVTNYKQEAIKKAADHMICSFFYALILFVGDTVKVINHLAST